MKFTPATVQRKTPYYWEGLTLYRSEDDSIVGGRSDINPGTGNIIATSFPFDPERFEVREFKANFMVIQEAERWLWKRAEELK